MGNTLSVFTKKHVPTVAAAIKALTLMGREVSLAKTYSELRTLMNGAQAIKHLAGDVEKVRETADDVISDACVRIGEEIAKTPKATYKGGPKKQSRTSGIKVGREATGIHRSTRARYITLAEHKADIPKLRKRLRKEGKEATVTALVREITQGDKKAKRADRERELASKILALPDVLVGLIVADPEYRFGPWSRETGMDRAAENHYPTSTLEVIKSRPVQKIAAKDCILFLWATIPMLPQALDVMKTWGFEYKSHCCWVKDKIGTGYWFREKHELLLIGTRGKPPAPAPGTQFESAIFAKRGRHSEKPEIFLEMIERYFPNIPKIELNRRGPPRKGWLAWGAEAEAAYKDAAE